MVKCCICGKEIEGYGNNPFPFIGEKCCDRCNETYVITVRLMMSKPEETEKIKKIVEEIKEIYKG